MKPFNPRRVLLAALLVAFLGGLAWLAWRHRSPEPVYQGKTLDAWLDELCTGSPTVYQAIRQIGPAAVPGIIRKLEENDSSSRKAYSNHWSALPPYFRKFLPKPKPAFLIKDAENAFAVLGPDAALPLIHTLRHKNPAVREAALPVIVYLDLKGNPQLLREALPCLISVLDNLENQTAEVTWYAARAIGGIGPAASNAIPALTAAFWKARRWGNDSGWDEAYAIAEIDPSGQFAIPILTNFVSNESTRVAYVIGRFGPAASNAVPLLMAALQSSEAVHTNYLQVSVGTGAADGLGKIGSGAQSALPLLTNVLASDDADLRVHAAAAIWRITSNESVGLPVLISEGPNLNVKIRWAVFEPLREMGPRAKAAVPMLLSELKRTNTDWQVWQVLDQITNALKAIDPEAAAKAGVK